MADYTEHFYKSNIFNKMERRTILRLTQTLRQGKIPPEYYSTNGYRENSVCLSKNGKNWEVYVAERGRQQDMVSYKALTDAAKAMLERVATSCEERKSLMTDFQYGHQPIIAIAGKPVAATAGKQSYISIKMGNRGKRRVVVQPHRDINAKVTVSSNSILADSHMQGGVMKKSASSLQKVGKLAKKIERR